MNGGFVIGVVLIALSFSAFLSRKPLPASEGWPKVLRYSKFLGIIGWVGLAFFTSIFIWGLLNLNTAGTGDKVSLLAFPLFDALMIWTIFAQRNSMVIFDEEKLIFQNSFRKRKAIAWKDITKADALSTALKLYDANQKIQFDINSMIGPNDFLKFLSKKVDPSVLTDRLKRLMSVRGLA